MLKSVLAGAASLLVLASAVSSKATTYNGTRTVGTTVVDLSIDTDGTIGTLARSDITDYSVNITNGSSSLILDPSNTQFVFIGDALTATSTSLDYDLSQTDENTLAFFLKPVGGSSYAIGNSGFVNPSDNSGESALINGIYNSIDETGVQVIASVPGITAAVPEPATWTLLITGIGIMGAALRRRRNAGSLLITG